MLQYDSKWEDDSYWYGNSFVIHILGEKTIQKDILSTGWHLISFKNFYCYVLLKFKKSHDENAHIIIK